MVRPRDEREASIMAEVYGRITGEPGVLAGQGPWIGSLGAIGQMEGRLASSPMVVITEASERGDYSTLAPYQQARGDYGVWTCRPPSTPTPRNTGSRARRRRPSAVSSWRSNTRPPDAPGRRRLFSMATPSAKRCPLTPFRRSGTATTRSRTGRRDPTQATSGRPSTRWPTPTAPSLSPATASLPRGLR